MSCAFSARAPIAVLWLALAAANACAPGVGDGPAADPGAAAGAGETPSPAGGPQPPGAPDARSPGAAPVAPLVADAAVPPPPRSDAASSLPPVAGADAGTAARDAAGRDTRVAVDLGGAADLPPPPAAGGTGPFLESGGLLVVEIESARASAGWAERTELAGFTGRGYYEWKPDDASTAITAAGQGVLAYPVRIGTAGRYRFQIRSSAPVAAEHNDVWARFPKGGAVYVDGEGKETPLGTGWFKVYSSGSLGKWTWVTATVDHNPKQIHVSFAAGDHLLELSGRSSRFKIDRFVLYTAAAGSAAATDVGRPQSPRAP